MSLRLVLVLAWLGCAGVAHAAATLPHHGADRSLGVATCSSSLCHGSSDEWKGSNVRQDEYLVWHRRDKHARAYAVLENAASKEIAKKLKLPVPAHESPVCLDCHAHNVPPARRGAKFVLADGVTCEACHGGAERWVTSHVAPNATHARNKAQGLFPTSDDVARARLCLSCHFGTRDKLVTHRIMAAGHPRLSFELDTFTEIAPPHWRIDADWQRRKGDWNGVRAWAVGQAIAAESLLAILVDPQRGRDGLFPELVLFDCHACHHPMSDRRDAGARLAARPGWVRLNDSSLLMLRHIARRVDAGGSAAFDAQLGRLHKAIASGNDGLSEARATQATIERLLPRIAGHRFGPEDLAAILSSLIDDGMTDQYTDYQGAEQAAMAIQSLAGMLARHGRLATAPLAPAMKTLMASVAFDERYSLDEFKRALRGVRAALQEGNR